MTQIVDSRDLPNSWRIVDDVTGNFRSRGLPFRYSYVGSFAQHLAEYFVRVYSNEGDTILDPFAGRGSVAMQALYHGRNMVCNDLSPYSNVLCHSVLWPQEEVDVLEVINLLEDRVKTECKRRSSGSSESSGSSGGSFYTYVGMGGAEDIGKLYEAKTFEKVVRLIGLLNSNEFLLGGGAKMHEVIMFLRASVSQLILGGSLAFNGMKVRATDNMNVSGILRYYRKLEEEGKGSVMDKEVDIFNNLRKYIRKMNLNDLRLKSRFAKLNRKLIACDAKELRLETGSIDGIITSPPYFHVLCYGQANWARLWALGGIGDPLVRPDIVGMDDNNNNNALTSSEVYGKAYDKVTNNTMSTLDGVKEYSYFTGQYLRELYRVLKDNAFAIIVVGNYGSKKKIEAWRIVEDRAVIFGFKTDKIIMDRLNASVKSSSQYNAKQGGGKNDYDVCVVLTKGDYKMKNDPEEIDFRWSEKFLDKRQKSIEEAWLT